MRSLPVLFVLALFFGSMFGCEPAPPPTNPAPATPSTPPSAVPPPPSTAPPAPTTVTPPSPSTTQTPVPSNNIEETPPPAPGMVREKADVGSGVKGHGYGEGLVATPAAQYWRVRENIAFRIQIPKAIQLFEATEGRPLRSEKEFWERIIKENHINLPQLPDGERYVFDLKTKELMVESSQ